MTPFALFFAALAAFASTALPDPPEHGVWPLQPHPVVREFEPPSSTWTAGHRGLDIEGAIGSPVLDSMAGTVSFAGVIAGRGVVVVDHGSTRTTYEPVVAEVTVGQVVGEGDRLGILDITQSHCFPAACLHWGWRRGDEYLDPRGLVGEPPRVRLLPLLP